MQASSSPKEVRITSNADETPIKVLVIGFGALGALYSWILARAGAQIYALARSNAKSVSTRGIDIQSDKYGNDKAFKPYKVFSSANEVESFEPYDYILCTMKIVPEEKKTGHLLKELLQGKGTHSKLPREKKPVIVFVENGIGIEEEPLETLCRGDDAIAGTIISCCAWLGATLKEGGTLVRHGAMESLQMGLYPAPNAQKDDKEELAWRMQKLKVFADTYIRGGGGGVMLEGDIQPLRWNKLFWNAGWGALSTLARQPVSVLLEDENLTLTASAVRNLMLEVLQVARACGIDEKALPESKLNDVFNLTYTQAPSVIAAGKQPNLASDFKPSLLVDLEANRGMELTPIIGNVIQKGKEHGIETPRLELVYASLRPSLIKVVQNQTKL